MSSIFGRLGVNENINNNVNPLSTDTSNTLKQMPSFMNEWQTTDVGNSDTGNYLQNSLETNINDIWDVSNNIISIAGLPQTTANTISAAANALYSSANNFMGHTNRLSGVAVVNENTATLPHYNTAVSVGKMVIYLTNQSDGIQNNSPIIGNFTSLFTANSLIDYYNTIKDYANTVSDSITTVPGDPPTYTCDLTNTQIQTIANNINEVATFMNTKRTENETFYTSCKSIVDDYNTVKQFSSMGDSELYLTKNFIGTEKLKSRLNS